MRKNRCPVLKNLHFSFRTFTIMIMTILVGPLKRGFSECPSRGAPRSPLRSRHSGGAHGGGVNCRRTENLSSLKQDGPGPPGAVKRPSRFP
jgi:hypothetical protein